MSDVAPKQKTTAAIYVPVTARGENQEKKLMALWQYAFASEWQWVEYRERPAEAKRRPVFSKMMGDARQRKFEVILVHSLDCFARSLSELSATITALQPFAIRIFSLSEGIGIDQETWEGRRFFFMLTAFVTAQKNMNVSNIRAGIARAQMKGVQCGRPRRRFPGAEARKLRKQGLSIRAIAARIGVPASTVADALRLSESTKPD